MSSPNPADRQPVWWTVEHTVIWKLAEPVLRKDFERGKAERLRKQEKAQGPDDAVLEMGAAAPRNVDVAHAHLIPDDNWELGVDWEDVKPAFRYGVGARRQYPDVPTWNEELERKLREDWAKAYEPSTWQKVKRAVRRGFEHGPRSN